MIAFSWLPVKSTLLIVSCCFCFSFNLKAQITDDKANDFAKADSMAALYPNHSLINLKELADKLTNPLDTDVDKFRAIFRWVCDNIESDYSFYVKNKAKREKLNDKPEELEQWNTQSNPYFFRRLLHDHKTICSGYAYLVKELCFQAGITCKIIDGYGRTVDANIGGTGIPNHSWNAVYLANQWYLCDATWSSGVIDSEQKQFISQFDEAYFLAPPALFVRNHYPLDTAWTFLKEKPTLHQFLNGPLIYKKLFPYNASPVYPETFTAIATKGEKFSFRFNKGSGLEIKKVELQLVQGSRTISVYPKLYTDTEGLTTIDYVFAHKGTYVVHILFNGDYVFTYTVTVSSR
ncbi:transglutaminase domain-containing protein [Cytophagaceae bacterium DM2B3-1]|uniref:Transglutaminase domain-containing protein n=1 Tax=Xanthocytophaga flava TaxID=3048013 RepID=A0ABT7CDM0_9BACT|nr:transglutaminase domain-containing protein [Xanthocytophaga flavus]MDJ1491807.1 transglutaminase domain-containing protein [Xanthocytophaga flavus]